MSFKPKMMPSLIGSMPYTDPVHAVNVSLAAAKGGAPIWPQLPCCSIREQMVIQYSGGMPGAVIEEEKKRMYFDTETDYCESFSLFYENYLAAMDQETGNGDCSAMAISPEFARGLYALENRLLSASAAKLPFLKTQVTGPCTFALSSVDEKKRSIYYHEEFRDMITKAIAMKSRWSVQKMKPLAENIICFLDEPILSAFGSSTYVSVKREDVVKMLKESVDAIHTERGVAGIHCCGNTEWTILVDAGVEIISFDAFQFAYTIALYPAEMKAFLTKGGVFAWGIVPTSAEVRNQTVDSLEAKLEEGMENLTKIGVDKKLITEQAILTPACGTGSISVEDANLVFDLLPKLSKRMRIKYESR